MADAAADESQPASETARERRHWPRELYCPSATTRRRVDILQTRGPPPAPTAVVRSWTHLSIPVCSRHQATQRTI